MIWLRLSVAGTLLIGVLAVLAVCLGIAAAITQRPDLAGAALWCFIMGLVLVPLTQAMAQNAGPDVVARMGSGRK